MSGPILRYRRVLLALLGLLTLLALRPFLATASVLPTQWGFTQVYFEQVGNDETIPGGIVTALAQDDKGFIWIGTQHGLVRHDGYLLRKFQHAEADPASLPDDYVRALWSGPDGRLWIGTSHGLAVFDPGSNRFGIYRHDPKQSAGLGGHVVRAITGNAAGAVWLGTENGLDYLPPGASTFTHFRHDPADPASLADNHVGTLLLDRHGRLWVGTGQGLQRMRADGKGFEAVATEPAGPAGSATLARQNIQALFEAADGKLWVATYRHGAAWLQVDGAGALASLPAHWLKLDPAHADGLSHGWVKSIAQPQPDQIWLATMGGGMNVVDARDGRVLQRLRHDPLVPGSLALDEVGALLRDQSGLLWVGTWAGGLQRHYAGNPGSNSAGNPASNPAGNAASNPAGQRAGSRAIRLLRHGLSTGGLSQRDVHAMLELEDGKILVGLGHNGIDIIDRQRGLLGGYRPKVGQSGALPDETINALAQTPDGTLWAATLHSGVLRRLPDGRWQAPASDWPKAPAVRLLRARDGRLWVGTTRGLLRWQPQRQRFEAVAALDGSVAQFSVNVMLEDAKGGIWVGTETGLRVLQAGQSGLRAIRHDPSASGSLRSDRVGGLLFDHLGRLWVSTSLGLDRLSSWDGQHARFEHIGPLAGAPELRPGANLLEDAAGRIWAGNTVIDVGQGRIYGVNKADGFDIGNRWAGAYAKTRDGLFLYGGTEGMAIVDPAQFQPWDYQPPVRVTELKIDGKAAPGNLLTAGPGLILHPEQHNFSIEFAALDYSASQKIRYSYRLQGGQQDEKMEWLETDAEHRTASYGNLAPGSYVLQVRASNRNGEWSAQQLALPIRVVPAFWQTIWFFALALLCSGAALYGAFRWRVARLRAKAHAMQNLIDARTADMLKLAAIGQELTATLDMEQAFERVYDQVMARLDADVFLIGMVEFGSINFAYVIEHRQRLPKVILDLDETHFPAVWCVREQREFIVNSHQELLAFLGDNLPPVSGDPMETVVYLPLLAGKSVIGCLSVQSPQPKAYNQNQLEFLRVLASYTAIALSNSVAHKDVTQSHEELAAALDFLKDTQAKLIQAERQQLSLDLHDNLSQTMTGVLLQLDTAREALMGEGEIDMPIGPAVDRGHAGLPYVERAIELARDGIAQTRHLLNQLRNKKGKPAPINLIDALRRDLPRLTVGTPIQVAVEQQGQPVLLSAAVELALFRVAQEAVTNALRHGKANKITLLLGYENASVVLTVVDDGCGFDPASPAMVPGIGLFGMQQRLAELHGRFAIDSAPGKGTCVTASLPIL